MWSGAWRHEEGEAERLKDSTFKERTVEGTLQVRAQATGCQFLHPAQSQKKV